MKTFIIILQIINIKSEYKNIIIFLLYIISYIITIYLINFPTNITKY